ncbi:AP2/B3 transcription factor family protein [Rhynchospora pubera]|uniref:AP2/B3 transcription factor family protein n=1 Tax=Rhynchospora pubera TaxID=906938 RepID=A0AAV8GVH6_9POAL|nr:AP2/B3 transcription factor family protein [Rhynchospora pubera]
MKLPSSRYRGVVAQQSGKWGAQIYKKNERIWLGTFCTEVEAAQTYDLAARCLHETNAVTNFSTCSKSDKVAKAELNFLRSHTTDDILSMLRRHTYDEELNRTRDMHQIQHLQCNNATTFMPNKSEDRELLFFKLISHGDVGQHSRLLIPRKHAQKHFPVFQKSNGVDHKGVMINCEDEEGRIWRFRYAYWSSSNNHVLNGGWTQFAKEKCLRPGDEVQFWRVTNEVGDVRLCIECHTSKAATFPSQPPLELPLSQPDKMIRLFGVNVYVLHDTGVFGKSAEQRTKNGSQNPLAN